jgi:hypothetical protein
MPIEPIALCRGRNDLSAGFFVFFSAVQNMQITLLILLARTCLSGSFIILNLYMAMLYPASMRHLSPLCIQRT